MENLSQEISINIINEVVKVVPYFGVDIKQQIQLRNKIEEQLI
jgi:UDP-N-acetyl-D-mannosaminuronate dehydrogenase